jgi:hypothetical protein
MLEVDQRKITITKSQFPNKFQLSNNQTIRGLGTWILVIIWVLVLDYWLLIAE